MKRGLHDLDGQHDEHGSGGEGDTYDLSQELTPAMIPPTSSI